MKPALLVVAIMVLSCGGATAQDAWQLASNSFNASFIEASARSRYLDQLGECFESFR